MEAKITKKIERLAKRAKKITEKLEASKILYKEKEAVVAEILEMGVKEFETHDFKMEVVDQFAGKNTKFKPAAFNRFELAFSALGPKEK
tara:strand:+ start:1315 stop:1581 length:267 start_codon:yes stop_codon:yes gene_type:complete